ncbi:efflux RND transporter periplasmic adaptor subunit [Agarilytica rhodophyticola]|uniref:efflux RND transporter periplasmic adaptor subunit n=1 Tax=Agarilytica rhodophyticola TaxID=1737490 RepID=UPI000B347DA5|nr:efflux RND transporter periplasmic adaptor subunit [Agarilytica rhodophyticola]
MKNENGAKNSFKHFIVCLLILFLGGGACVALISLASPKVNINSELDTRPAVASVPVSLIQYQTQINVAGVLEAAEKTDIAFELTGKIAWLNAAFIEGGIVKKGTILATLESFDYETQVSQQKAQLALAEADLAREIAMAKVAKVEWANNPKTTDLALRKPQVDSAKAQVTAAKANLALAEKNLTRTKYYAPYDALITGRDTGLGQVISEGESLGEMVNLSYGEIRIPIAGFDRPFLPKLPGDGIQIFPDPISPGPLSQEQSVRSGILTRHIGQFNNNTRMAYYIVRVDDPYGINTKLPPLHYGQFLQARIPGKHLSNVLKVPQEWIRNKSIWLVSQEQKLVEQPVTILRQEQDYALIEGDKWTNNGYRIVNQLPEYPQHGMLVKDTFSAAKLALKE